MPDLPYGDYLAISNTKARYCRCLDEKDWLGYGDVFTEDAVLDATGSGGPVVEGREAILRFLSRSLAGAKTAHQVHSPEFTLIDADTAEVIWAMQDRVVWNGTRRLTGFGHYRETYVRCPDGRWRIARSALSRLHLDYVEN